MKEQKIIKIEDDGFVIKSAKLVNDAIVCYEDVECLDDIDAVEVVSLQDYEENGFDLCGLQGKWVTL